MVEAKDSKERLYRCNDIQVKAELTLVSVMLPQASDPAAQTGLSRSQGAQAIHSTSQIGQVSSNSNGTYTITFTPSTAGCCNLSITINGQHIKDSPKSITVGTQKK